MTNKETNTPIKDRIIPLHKINMTTLCIAGIRGAIEFVLTGVTSPATFAEVLKSIDFRKSKSKQAHRLVLKSWEAAIEKQLADKESNIRGIKLAKEDKDIFKYLLLKDFEDKSYELTPSTFKKAEDLPLILDFLAPYKRWLMHYLQVSEHHAELLANDLPDTFAYTFYEELRDNEEDYKELIDYLDSPFNADLDRLNRKRTHNNYLKSLYRKRVLSEKEVFLPDVYIQPSFKVYEQILSYEGANNDAKEEWEHYRSINFDGGIHQYLKHYFLKGKTLQAINNKRAEQSRLMILLGQPGHGKSSFCYYSIYDLLNTRIFRGDIYFCRLQNMSRTLIDQPLNVLDQRIKGNHQIFLKNRLEEGEKKQVLFLDGLDEMYMVNSLSDEEVLRFLQACNHLLNDYPKLYIIITSRFNYVPSNRLYSNDKRLLLALDVLNKEQQKDLIEKFKARKGWEEQDCNLNQAVFEKIEEEELPHIQELIELPILLQMILISGVDLQQEQMSKAAIYKELFEKVVHRGWAEEGRFVKYKDNKKFQPHHLQAYMGVLAYHIYKENKGYLNRTSISNLRETKKFIKGMLKLEAKEGSSQEDHLKAALKDVLTSFYLQETPKKAQLERQAGTAQQDQDQEYAIEFLHKSLYEYLACEHIWNSFKAFFLKWNTEEEDYEDYDIIQVQQKLQALFANIRLSKELMGYLKEIIDQDTKEHDVLMERIVQYLPDLFKYGFLYEWKTNTTTPIRFRAEEQALNCFYIFWLILGQLKQYKVRELDHFELEWGDFYQKYFEENQKEHYIAIYQEEMKELKEGIEKRFGEISSKRLEAINQQTTEFVNWIRQLPLKDSSNETNMISLQNWIRRYYYQKAGQAFYKDLIHTIHIHKNILGHWLRLLAVGRFSTQLSFAFLDLKEIDLASLRIERINFIGVDLSHTDLSRTDLWNANLSYANLSCANFSRTDLINIDLSYANLSYTYLSYTYLIDAYLRNADLRNAYLSYADLRNADLRNADLSRADLRNSRVDRKDWLDYLQTQNIKGIAEIVERYTISQEKRTFTDRWGNEYEAYEILPR